MSYPFGVKVHGLRFCMMMNAYFKWFNKFNNLKIKAIKKKTAYIQGMKETSRPTKK